jgi:hypothetical protein
MAPKKRALSAKAAASAKKAPKVTSKALDALDAEELDDKKATKGDRLRTKDQAWNKMISDNFLEHGFTMEEVNTAQMSDGTFLIDTLQRDRERWVRKEISMGMKYWTKLRLEVRSPDSVYSLLAPSHESEIDENIYEALCALCAKKRDFGRMDVLINTPPTIVAESTVCAIFKTLLMIPCAKGLDHTQAAISLMTFIAAADLKAKWSKHFECIQAQCNAALEREVVSFHAQDHTCRPKTNTHFPTFFVMFVYLLM